MSTEHERLRQALADRYTLERALGRGGMATVYLAYDLKHHRQVAIKVLKPELAAALGPDRFVREIDIAAGLRHPQIVPLYESGEAQGFLYYVMPYVEGEPLRDRLNRDKHLPLEDAVRITLDVADALSYAHRHDVVHRDIKPENILLESGHAVVADFGIARAITAAGGDRLTETGIAVGTPAYMSPEQATGAQEVDARSDVYSLACVLFEMLCGDPPFAGSSAQGILSRKAVDTAPSVHSVRRTVPEVVEQALTRALATVPADRFATAQAFAVALQAPARPSRRRWLLPTAIAATLALAAGVWTFVARDQSLPSRFDRLAVLPFTDLTGDSGQQYFVDAMHDAVIAELATIRALTTKSRQSVLRYRHTDKSIPEIARELGVDAVVEGSVFREGDSVRITVQLLQALPGERHLWGRTFQRDIRGLLALHGEVARAIAERIEIAIAPQELERLQQARPVNPAAYEAWLRGWVESTRLSATANERCIAHARAAITIDSTYAPAHALVARCYNNLTIVSPTPPQDAFPKAKAAALRAIELDASLADAHAVLAWVLAAYDWDWPGAERAFGRALELAPGSWSSHQFYARFLAAMGRSDEALEHATRAQEGSPTTPGTSHAVTTAFYIARRFDEALAHAQQAVDLFPDDGQSYDRLAWVLDALGRYDQAVSAWEKAIKLKGDVYSIAFLGRTNALAGRREAALRILHELLTEADTSYVPPLAIAFLYDGLRQRDETIHWLERSYDRRDTHMLWVNVWPGLDSIRPDPRFQRLVRRMNFPR